jgi:uncharacterized protein HemX
MTHAGGDSSVGLDHPGDQPQAAAQQLPGAAPAPRKKTGVIVLSVVTVLLLVGAGAFGVLYLNEKKRSDTVASQLADKEKALTDSDKQLKDTKDKLSRAEEAKQAAETEKGQLAKCRDAATDLRAAAFADDQPRGEEALKALFLAC